MYHNLCFEQKYETSKNILTKNCHFSVVKNRCILHGCVFLMGQNSIKNNGGLC